MVDVSFWLTIGIEVPRLPGSGCDEVFEPPSEEAPDLLANRWRAKYEKQKGVVEGRWHQWLQFLWQS